MNQNNKPDFIIDPTRREFVPVSWINAELDFTGKDWFPVEDIECGVIESIIKELT